MWRQENIRADYNLNSHNTFMGRFTQDTWTNNAYNAGYWGEDPFPVIERQLDQPSKSVVGKWTRTIGTTMVNDARVQLFEQPDQHYAGRNQSRNGYRLYGDALLNAISSAIPTEYPQSIKRDPLAFLPCGADMGNYGSGNNYWSIAPWNNTLDLYVAKDDASKIIGRHTLKFGLLMSWNGKNEDVSTSSSERPIFATDDGNLTYTDAAGTDSRHREQPGQCSAARRCLELAGDLDECPRAIALA